MCRRVGVVGTSRSVSTSVLYVSSEAKIFLERVPVDKRLAFSFSLSLLHT